MVTNLVDNITLADLETIFSTCGAIKSLKMDNDATGKFQVILSNTNILSCQGSATIVYGNLESANKAIAEYNERLLDTRPMKVYIINSKLLLLKQRVFKL